ncbi:MAG: hypothetical protein ACYC27_08610 [Armatimonadota bacterium]
MVTISGNPPLGVAKILVATEDYLASKMQEQGCIVRYTNKKVSSALMEYIASKGTVGDESWQPETNESREIPER